MTRTRSDAPGSSAIRSTLKPDSSLHIHTNGELINHRSFATSMCPNFWLHWDDESHVDLETGPKGFYFMLVRF